MSAYIFLASDSPLKNIYNTKIKLYSVDEAKKQGVLENADGWIKDWADNAGTEKSQKENTIMHVDYLEDLGELEIIPGYYKVDMYTKKRYNCAVSITYTTDRTKALIDYIAEHLTEAGEIELWHIWMDEEKTPVISECMLNKLDEAHIKSILYHDLYIPVCLIVKKSNL